MVADVSSRKFDEKKEGWHFPAHKRTLVKIGALN